jgi:polyisoprenoid-binding protein YceI
MSRKSVLISVVVVVALAAAGIWYFVLRSDAPPPVSLDSAVESVTESTTTTEGTSGGEPTTTTTTTAAPTTSPSAGLDGDWDIDTTTSFAGYRVKEELASIGFTEAVGRTSDLVGGLTIEGTSLTAVVVDVDMTTLESDSSRRDGALASRGLETSEFPTATFVLTEPIDLGSLPAVGEAIAVDAVGELTLHGVTNTVTIPLEAQLVDDTTIVVVGSLEVAFADYEIESPTGFSVLDIEDPGTLELQIAFVRT